MIDVNDFKKPNNRNYTEEEYYRYLEHVFDAYTNDNRFRELLDEVISLKHIYSIDKLWVFSTMLGFRNDRGIFLLDITYPPYHVYHRKLKIYVDKTLDYQYLTNEYHKIEIKYSSKGNVLNHGHPVTEIQSEDDVNWMISVIRYIIASLCKPH